MASAPHYIAPTIAPSDALGIFQADVIIRSAIIAGIRDVLANDWLIDYVFSSLNRDGLTVNDYGQNEIDNAKKWLKNIDIDDVVVMDTYNGDIRFPRITIKLESSTEEENTLGDVHYVALEQMADPWPDLVLPFTPTSYSPVTGTMVVPSSIPNLLELSTSMVLVTRAGVPYAVTDVTADDTLVLTAGVNDDFSNCTIRSVIPGMIRHMESAAFHETYVIGCHVHGESVYLTFLHSLLCFVLLRYRQTLFEGRGFEASHFSSTDFAKSEQFEPENVYSRYISLTGIVRQYWPKQIVPSITSTIFVPSIYPAGNVPLDPANSYTGQLKDESWIGDQDALNIVFPTGSSTGQSEDQ
jgi:hypothetical protein